jgi:hypothetical protein
VTLVRWRLGRRSAVFQGIRSLLQHASQLQCGTSLTLQSRPTHGWAHCQVSRGRVQMVPFASAAVQVTSSGLTHVTSPARRSGSKQEVTVATRVCSAAKHHARPTCRQRAGRRCRRQAAGCSCLVILADNPRREAYQQQLHVLTTPELASACECRVYGELGCASIQIDHRHDGV